MAPAKPIRAPVTIRSLARHAAALAGALAVPLLATPAAARTTVDASAPQDLAVTLYRDPNRGEGEEMNRNWPQGFAMITETRTVTLPPGESTIRFTGVAEGMVAVSAIVTGLPGGTIEKNRNADLLSPAALVDGTLGNRVTITRTNPGTGEQTRESAIVRTRADGGLVLQTGEGFEAVRCSGLPESLTFDRVPQGLSAQPVYTIDTQDARGGTYTVELTYLAWGFDWQANYVAHVEPPSGRNPGEDMRLRLMSWLTLLNDNGQSFPDAELLVIAGTLNVESDYRALSDPPEARPLRLTCYPLGHSWEGSGDGYGGGYPPPPPPPPPPAPMAPQMMLDEAIVVTGARAVSKVMMATEEDLGDLKLYRVPERVTVSAKGLKQVAFLDKDAVQGSLVYEATCSPWDRNQGSLPVAMRFETVNDKRHGLGVALPQGGITFYEPSSVGPLFVGEQQMSDQPAGQDVEIALGESAQVFAACELAAGPEPGENWGRMHTRLTNANPSPVTVRIILGYPAQWNLRGLKGTRVKDGQTVYEVSVPANGTREVGWEAREAGA